MISKSFRSPMGAGALLVSVVAGLMACTSDSTGPVVQPGTLGVTPANAAVSIQQGEEANVALTINRGGYTGRVTFEVEGAPQGVSITPTPVTIGSSTTEAQLNVKVGIPAPAGTHTLTIKAVGVEPGAVEASTQVTLTVVPAIQVVVNPGTATIHVPDTQQLGVSVTNTTNTAVTWSSSNTAVATVSTTGLVTAVGRGTATITATSAANTTRTGSATITVGAIPLTLGTPLTALSNPAARGANLFWYVQAAPGTSVTVTLAGGTGDVDLYLLSAFGLTSANLLCASFNDGNNESCTATVPASGRLFIALNTWDPWSGVTLTATTP